MPRKDGLDRPVPNICLKVPTGGGKTLLGTVAVERISVEYFKKQAGFVLWIVPSDAIYKQTWSAFANREHPYRQMLERASGGRVRLLEMDDDGVDEQMTADDILVVSPYNAQVSRLTERLEPMGVRVGTVDKFQGQEAPVVIYSMATSRPEDAPRGMEFLYSLNRLNVASSRARCAAIVVASPRLFEPECRTPRQMKLANALCRYRELSKNLA